MLYFLLLAVVTPLVVLGLLSSLARRPENLGVHHGRLTACPESPNCVSSQADTPQHSMEPIHFTGSGAAAIGQLRSILEEQPRSAIITADRSYMHAEFTSRIFRFVDDVEFFVDDSQQVIHFRSASRAGYSDLGANRQRMELIRALFEQKGARSTSDQRTGH
ncbi:MAG TPA: DUF1499 domain-containing protein [Pirellulales bacterium]|nr:DUF1499 domain-containing protein [Pirellulales bacterium]